VAETKATEVREKQRGKGEIRQCANKVITKLHIGEKGGGGRPLVKELGELEKGCHGSGGHALGSVQKKNLYNPRLPVRAIQKGSESPRSWRGGASGDRDLKTRRTLRPTKKPASGREALPQKG